MNKIEIHFLTNALTAKAAVCFVTLFTGIRRATLGHTLVVSAVLDVIKGANTIEVILKLRLILKFKTDKR